MCIHHNHRTSLSANLTTANQQTSRRSNLTTAHPRTVGPRMLQISTNTAANSSNSIIKKKNWNLWIGARKNVVRRENIEAAVRRVMDGDDGDREG
ncbi:unnamed protein product [Camellia sinensis]